MATEASRREPMDTTAAGFESWYNEFQEKHLGNIKEISISQVTRKLLKTTELQNEEIFRSIPDQYKRPRARISGSAGEQRRSNNEDLSAPHNAIHSIPDSLLLGQASGTEMSNPRTSSRRFRDRNDCKASAACRQLCTVLPVARTKRKSSENWASLNGGHRYWLRKRKIVPNHVGGDNHAPMIPIRANKGQLKADTTSRCWVH
eukprot:gb/GECG01004519.1/.p1 GENE.gb/GECG01004519.1/~~gb/GECG01004519.1/.p1  ORF type:complete len:203 (+),score=17.35 gb/GECG01004519.1/:1-609(+)